MQNMDRNEKLKELATGLITNGNQFIVDASLSKHRPMKVTVLLDGDKGVNIDDCASLSRMLTEALDKDLLAGEDYTLEVSSPGLDHPLKLKRQYIKNIGRNLKIHLTEKTIVQAKLTGVTESGITVETSEREGKRIELKKNEIPFTEIEKTFVMVSFN